jgi:hypothetical protein
MCLNQCQAWNDKSAHRYILKSYNSSLFWITLGSLKLNRMCKTVCVGVYDWPLHERLGTLFHGYGDRVAASDRWPSPWVLMHQSMKCMMDKYIQMVGQSALELSSVSSIELHSFR